MKALIRGQRRCTSIHAAIICDYYIKETHMKLSAHLGRVLADDHGGAVLEYALLAGLIIVGVVALLTSVGNNVLACWTSLNG